MRAQALRALAVVVVLCAVGGVAGAQNGNTLQVAVSPFENTGPRDADDYLGFQISEFLSTALASFDGIRVVERRRIQDVIDEQKFQLSGLTASGSGVELGRLLNAEQIILGSFSRSGTALTVSARMIEVETAEVRASATVEASGGDSYTPAYRALLFELISNLPEYDVTIPVEARLEALSEQSTEASATYARALEALYRQEDEAALALLEESIGGAEIDVLRFNDIAREYTEVLQRVQGTSVFTRMIQNQVDHNTELMEQLEPLALHRSTLKILSDRVEAVLSADQITMTADVPSIDRWELGTVSAIAPPPRRVTVSLSREAVEAIEAQFAEQDIATLGPDGISVSPPPAGRLLDRRAIAPLLEPAWRAEVGYAVEFLDGDGEVVYRLVAEPQPFVTIDGESRRLENNMAVQLSAVEPRDGWQIREDGSVEIQSRELRNVSSVRVVVLPETLEVEAGFPLYSDNHWRSLITHAYRKRSVKTVQENDSAPAFKEIVIADSWFRTGDPEIDPVPMLPRDRQVAPFADLTGVVYFADNASGTVMGSWQGAISGESESVAAELGPESVLYFPAPETDDGLTRGFIRFRAEFGDSVARASASARLGESWTAEPGGGAIALDRFSVYVGGNSTTKLNRDTGRELWSTDEDSEDLVLSDGVLYAADSGYGTRALRTRSGAVAWENPDADAHDVALSEDRVLAIYSGRRARSLHRDSGTELWAKGGSRYGGHEALTAGSVIYITGNSGTAAIDTRTGEEVWSTTDHDGDDLVLAGSVLYVADGSSGTRALHAASGRTLWEDGRADGTNIAVEGNAVFVGEDGYLGALDAGSGIEAWSADVDGVNDIIVSGGVVYATDSSRGTVALEARTGTTLWTASRIRGNEVRVDDGKLFIVGRDTWRLDLAAIPTLRSATTTLSVPGAEPVALTRGSWTNGRMTSGGPAHRGKTVREFTLPVRRGERIQVDLMSSDFDTYLYVLDGSEEYRDDDGGSNRNSRVRFTASRTGTVRILASSYDGGSRGEFRLRAREE